jgi:hypothetical protein
MSRLFNIRKENLRRLAEEHGGAAALSKLIGHANSSRLSQLIGTGATDDISEKVARTIEHALKLPENYLDEDRGSSEQTDPVSQISAAIRDLVAELGNDAVSRIPEDRFGEVCALLLHECRASGRVESQFIKRLVRVIGAQ